MSFQEGMQVTKLAEIKDASELNSKIKYVNQVWASWREARSQTLHRITNYLFVLNSGALLAALTYVAAKPANPSIHISIWIFSAGIFFSAAHATLDYYVSESEFSKYKKNVESLYDNKLDWEVFADRCEQTPPYDRLLHTLGWLGGIVFFIGMISGVLQILAK